MCHLSFLAAAVRLSSTSYLQALSNLLQLSCHRLRFEYSQSGVLDSFIWHLGSGARGQTLHHNLCQLPRIYLRSDWRHRSYTGFILSSVTPLFSNVSTFPPFGSPDHYMHSRSIIHISLVTQPPAATKQPTEALSLLISFLSLERLLFYFRRFRICS